VPRPAAAADDELRRLRRGPGEEAPPSDVETLAVECADCGASLERVREVLGAVLTRPDAEWPGVEEWRRVLPTWFVERCVDDAELRDCVVDKWSLRAWVYWFQPGMRRWRWWDATVTEGRLEVRIAVLKRPYLRGALEWLLKVAAA
jgi:hypothetical protein